MNPVRLLSLLIFALSLGACSSGHDTFQAGRRIVFFGDSITELGARPAGYITVVRDSLHRTAAGNGWEILGAGISGNRVPDLLARLDRDVIPRKPSTVVIYIGINDVWHWALLNKGTPTDEFKTGLIQLISRIRAEGAGIILCTPSVIGEKPDGTNAQDAMLEEYATIQRTVAQETGTPVCDLRKAFIDYLKQHNPEHKERGVLTTDGVHLNEAGNRFVAETMISALTQ